ncbi:unnamed protein product [Caenorhabditis sp. 36 PRJEB53466]|nr:unnamed protein product [Caenorhabditis sp. 36 PRJEB53466]
MLRRASITLDQILASVSLQNDEVVRTPEPVQAVSPMLSEKEKNVEKEETPSTSVLDHAEEAEISDEGTTLSTASAEDIPLTLELLSPSYMIRSSNGVSYCFKSYSQRHFMGSSCGDDRSKRHETRQQESSNPRVPLKKNGLPINLPAPSESVFEYDSTCE